MFNLGGEWKFIPDKKGLNKGIKFADPIVLTPENTECEFDLEEFDQGRPRGLTVH